MCQTPFWYGRGGGGGRTVCRVGRGGGVKGIKKLGRLWLGWGEGNSWAAGKGGGGRWLRYWKYVEAYFTGWWKKFSTRYMYMYWKKHKYGLLLLYVNSKKPENCTLNITSSFFFPFFDPPSKDTNMCMYTFNNLSQQTSLISPGIDSLPSTSKVILTSF